MKQQGRGALYNIAVVYVGKILGILVSVFTLRAITGYLGVEDFGHYSVVLTYSALIVSIADLGIGWIAAREIARGNRAVFVPLRSLKYLVSLVVVLGSLLVVPLLGYATTVQQGVIMAAFFTFLTAVNSFQIGVLQGSRELNKTVYGDILGRLVLLGSIYAIQKFDLGIQVLFLSLNLVGLTVYACNAWFISRLSYSNLPWNLQGAHEFRHDFQTMPVVIAISYIVAKVDLLILARLASEVDVGIYSAAYRILDVAMAIPSIFVGVLAPIFSNRLASGNEVETRRVFAQSFTGLTLLAGPVAVALAFLAPYAIRLLAGEAFMQVGDQTLWGRVVTSSGVLQILSAYLFFAFFGSYFSSVLLAAKKQAGLIVTGATGLVLSIVANMLLIPHYSYLASSFITLGVEIVMIAGMMYFLARAKIASGSRLLFAQAIIIFGGLLAAGKLLEVNPLISAFGGAALFVVLLIIVNGNARELAVVQLKNRWSARG